MKLIFDTELSENYKSQSQKARVLTEAWVGKSIFCPNCGNASIKGYKSGKPVADFFCESCGEDYELKSKKDTMGNKIVDGAYRTMIERLTSINNPNLFLLHYNLVNSEVKNFLVIPKHFFVPKIIERRKPLAPTAVRAGWVGCNILLNLIPQSCKIFFVRNGKVERKEKILGEWGKTLFLREQNDVPTRGWLLDVMSSIDKLGNKEFTSR